MKRFLFYALPLAVILMGAGCFGTTSASPQSTPLQKTTNGTQPSALPTAPTKSTPAISGPSLDLSGQQLTSIPSDVFSRTDLVSLNLSNNKLTGAPQAEIRHLEHLKELDLSNNNLTGLPAELGQLQQLEILNVSHNQLSGLPLELDNLHNLKVLDLTGNPYSKQDLEVIAAKIPNAEIRK